MEKNIDISKLTSKHIKNTTYIEAQDLCGEGTDIFVLLNKEMLNFIKQFPSCFLNAYIDAREVDEMEMEIKASDVGKNIYGFERTQHYSKSVEDLEEYYGRDNSQQPTIEIVGLRE